MSVDRLQPGAVKTPPTPTRWRWLIALGVGALVLAVAAGSRAATDGTRARPGHGLASPASDPAAVILVFNKQNPRWESLEHAPAHQFRKPYKPLHQPPGNVPPRLHPARHGSEVLNRSVVLALVGIIVLAAFAGWLSSALGLPTAWIALLFGLIAGPVAGVLDPDVLFGNLLLPLVSLCFVVLLFDNLLDAHFAAIGPLGAAVAPLVTIESAIVCAGTAGIAALIGLTPAVATLLMGLLVMALRAAGPGARDETSVLLEWEGIVLELVGSVLALVACEWALSGQLHRDDVSVITGLAETTLGGGLTGVALGMVLARLLQRGWVAERSRRPFLWVTALTAFAAADLLREGCGFFAVLGLGLYLANQGKVGLGRTHDSSSIPRVLVSALLVVLAARVSLDEMLTAGTSRLMWPGLALLVGLLLVARLATGRTRLPWSARLALASPAATTASVIAAAAVCGLRLHEFGIPQGEQVAGLALLVVFMRLAVCGIAGMFESHGLSAAEAQPEAAPPATPATR